ncbi:MAG: LacI family DNA-binding transcriptional regulator [Candidatus Izemoplasmatales bacterium]|jgi:LacI family transcriptional regulator|nr:LacI family DNA-binding transcriptional regulator [Candidatus Izemoplasmatales bacterium]
MKTTIYDVAKAMNLSPGTISKILHNNGNVSVDTRTRVLEYIKEVGYVADTNARILKSKHSWTIGVIFADISLIGLEHPFFASIIQHFKNYVEKQGYELVFIVTKLGENELTYLEWCKNKKVDGVLIVSGNPNNQNIIELVESDIPSVSTDIIRPRLNSVLSDDYCGVSLCIQYAISLEMDKIACITGPLTTRAFSERLDAYDKILKEKGLFDKYTAFQEAESFGFTSGFNATMKLLESVSEIPQMILSFSDDLAFGVIRAIEAKGFRVPEDISVIGFDDIQFAKHFTPSLTTIRQNKILIAETAAKLLLENIQGKSEKRDIVIKTPVDLVIRNSTIIR